jgi:dihydroorotate dehydrogenase (NAD+) catalytic subunit
MGIDVRTRKPVLSNITGGMSGPAIHPITLRLVYMVASQFANEAGVPIMAVGGVTRWEDAAEFILAGACCVQIGAGSFADPRIPEKVARGLDKWCLKQGVGSIQDLVGGVLVEND